MTSQRQRGALHRAVSPGQAILLGRHDDNCSQAAKKGEL